MRAGGLEGDATNDGGIILARSGNMLDTARCRAFKRGPAQTNNALGSNLHHRIGFPDRVRMRPDPGNL
jgi:hypothetical protein